MVYPMKILVTGGAGFIGSHVVDGYVASGNKVTIIDNLVSGKKENVNSEVVLIKGDITDRDLVNRVFCEHGPFDVVNHLAAQKSVTDSVKDPIYDAQTNIIGALLVLEAARKHGVKQIIFSSTGGALYGEGTDLPMAEDAPILPMAPYGIAKYSVEHYLRFYQQLGLTTSILRYSNVYGPRQDPNGEAGVVAIFCEKIHTKSPITIYGDGHQTRDFVYVNDVVVANMLVTTQAKSGVWNIGTGREVSVNQLAGVLNKIAEAKNLTPSEISYAPSRQGELKRSAIDIKKAKQELNWQPRTSLEAGLRQTLESFL